MERLGKSSIDDLANMARETSGLLKRKMDSIALGDLRAKTIQLQALVLYLKNTYEFVNTIYEDCRVRIEDALSEISHPQTIPATIRDFATKPHEYKISNEIALPVEYVKYMDMIPDTPLYYVEQDKCFAIKINGIIVRGNLGIISDNPPKSVPCRSSARHPADQCDFYHDEDQRNFKTFSWVYTSDEIDRKNKNMRHIGNKATLLFDIKRLTMPDLMCEYKLRESQMMHDMLVLMTLRKYI